MKSPHTKFIHSLLIAILVASSGCIMATWAGMLWPTLLVIVLISVPIFIIATARDE